MHGNAVGRRFEPGDVPHGVDQRLSVMRPGAADQRSIDIEKYEIR